MRHDYEDMGSYLFIAHYCEILLGIHQAAVRAAVCTVMAKTTTAACMNAVQMIASTYQVEMSCCTVFDQIKGQHGIAYSLRKEQATVLDLLLDKKNVLAVLPTGFGKSVIYALLPSMLHQVKFHYENMQNAYTCNERVFA